MASRARSDFRDKASEMFRSEDVILVTGVTEQEVLDDFTAYRRRR